jgi:hypothetical protein
MAEKTMSELALETETRKSVLMLRIAGDWYVDDFSDLFEFCFRYYVWFYTGDEIVREVWAPRVANVNYGSPGTINIVGLGEVMKELIMYLMDRDQIRKQKELDIEEQIWKLRKREIDDILKIMRRAKSGGVTRSRVFSE